ncbi:hypothetical protein M124_0416 [Bacteroides fragilis str. 3988T(B)14]|jgi:hypothetical protein|uniref:Uncharacterized protein n=2 Tax=Bacteroides fragilis TaxID=817 RepID=A0A015SUH3_BACFG|nr:hypothetical protein M124_0416 [Bacteroides fragilis str. 3988T(B)14]EXY81688.1 hypothetical protein M084_0451 [Bacteroides fragilis str. 3988 T1]OCR36204.1 hypothetical protein AC094_05190 [Bacteroides fragilis]
MLLGYCMDFLEILLLFLYLKKYYFCNKPLSFCKKDIDTFIYVLIISDLYY